MRILVLRPNARQKEESSGLVAGLPQGFWRLSISGEPPCRILIPLSSMASPCHSDEPASMACLGRKPSFPLWCGCGTHGNPGFLCNGALAGVLEMAKLSLPAPLVIASAAERKGDMPWDTNEARVVSRMAVSDGSSRRCDRRILSCLSNPKLLFFSSSPALPTTQAFYAPKRSSSDPVVGLDGAGLPMAVELEEEGDRGGAGSAAEVRCRFLDSTARVDGLATRLASSARSRLAARCLGCQGGSSSQRFGGRGGSWIVGSVRVCGRATVVDGRAQVRDGGMG